MALRRSGRERRKSSKLAEQSDPIFAAILSESDAPSDHEMSEREDPPVIVMDEESEQDEELSAAEDVSNEEDGGEEVVEEGDYGSDVIAVEDLGDDYSPRKPKSKRVKYARRPESLADPDVRVRGVTIYNRSWVKHHTIPFTLGEDANAVAAFDKMSKSFDNERVLPNRDQMVYTYFRSEEDRRKEATEGWTWYYERGGRTAFQDRQKHEVLDEAQSNVYLPDCATWGRSVFYKSHVEETICNIPPLQALPFDSSIWDQHIRNQHRPRAWIINAGDCVQSLAWAPNQSSLIHYLALSIMTDVKEMSAFSPSPPTPSAIQIWAFQAARCGEGAATLDMSLSPNLVKVYCCEWGRIRQLKWCPAERKSRAEYDNEQVAYLGLLAVISSDGKLRILDIHCKKDSVNKTEYVKIISVAFESCPPETVFTSVAWNTCTTITAACANGYVTVFNIVSHLLDRSSPPVAIPSINHPVNASYINAVISCYPTCPHHIITSSTDGYLPLIDLRDPSSDTITPSRNRYSSASLLWHQHLCHAIYSEEGSTLRLYNPRQFFNGLIICQFEAGMAMADCSPVHSSVVVGMLDGTVWVIDPTKRAVAKGERGRDREVRGGWRVEWLNHEWRRPQPLHKSSVTDDAAMRRRVNGPMNHTDGEDGDQTMSPSNHANTQTTDSIRSGSNLGKNADAQQLPAGNQSSVPQSVEVDYPTGLTIFTTPALKRQPMDLTTTGGVNPRKPKKKTLPNGVRLEEVSTKTIFEEQSGVKAVAWNPNIGAGGWVAVGWGDGLVVVADLCVEEVPGRGRPRKRKAEDGDKAEAAERAGEDMETDDVIEKAMKDGNQSDKAPDEQDMEDFLRPVVEQDGS